MVEITTGFYIWGFVNLLAGLWEVYAFANRHLLKLEKRTIWEKIYKGEGEITISNFWIEGWSEYCKVDSRYIYRQYVWFFELLNAVISVIFIMALILKNYNLCMSLLAISIINCLGYFFTLFIDVVLCKIEGVARYSKFWMFPVYYLISGIWLIVPWMLYYGV